MSEHQADPPDTSGHGHGAIDRDHVDHHAPTVARNARVGLWLFAVYVLLYGGFMALNAFYPKRMGQPAIGGVNLAVTYGMVLIVGAFLLALVYMFLVRGRAGGDNGGGR